jgi:glycosyltransferase involved in cell wall biosynthesis
VISVISPFYNEEAILEQSILRTYEELSRLEGRWEWIVVNDGSVDASLEIARRMAGTLEHLRVVSYPVHRGRGRALREGIRKAGGDIVVTTEVDSSWTGDVVARLADTLRRRPDLDAVIASPNARGGAYRNVPWKRKWMSIAGNGLIRLFFTKKITMNTGMTRAYRRDIIQGLPLEEDGKEFHLEVLLKLLSLNCRVEEIPAVLEWKEDRLLAAGMVRPRRHDVRGLIHTHMLFAVFANPIRYFWLLSLLCGVVGTGALGWGLYNFAVGGVAAYLVLLSLSLFIAALLFFGLGIVTAQNRSLEKESWRIRMALNQRDVVDAARERDELSY